MDLDLTHVCIASILVVRHNSDLDHECPYRSLVLVFQWYHDPPRRLRHIDQFNLSEIVKVVASADGQPTTKHKLGLQKCVSGNVTCRLISSQRNKSRKVNVQPPPCFAKITNSIVHFAFCNSFILEILCTQAEILHGSYKKLPVDQHPQGSYA